MIFFLLLRKDRVISTSNKLNRAVVKIDESLSRIDVALTKMVDVVKAWKRNFIWRKKEDVKIDL